MNFAVVTGASGGIGLEFARQLAAQGRNVILVARSRAKLEAAAQEISAACKVEARALVADLSAEGAARTVFEQASALGDVDILVNNAGAGLCGQAVDLDPAAVRGMIALNVTALTELCALFAARMKANGGGRILNVSSVAGNWPEPFFASYAATKAYVSSFSVSLSEELRGSLVSVSCLLPGFVSTDFDDNARIASDRYKRFSRSLSMTPAAVAKKGLQLMFAGRSFGVAGWINAATCFFNGLLPRQLQARIMRTSIQNLL